jgi:hypothetical protein
MSLDTQFMSPSLLKALRRSGDMNHPGEGRGDEFGDADGRAG